MNLEEKLKVKAVDRQHDNVCYVCSKDAESKPRLMIDLSEALSITQQEIDDAVKADRLRWQKELEKIFPPESPKESE